MRDITAYIVFFEGMATFLSPCILPLLPIYISYITGYSAEELEGGPGFKRWGVVFNAAFFVLGLSLAFILLGITVSALGRFLAGNRVLLRRISGITIMAMGLYISGFIKLPLPGTYKRFSLKPGKGRAFTSLVLGIAFGLGWTPCVGPILGSVLMLAGASATVGRGITLLAIYSLGLGVPFLISAAAIDCFAKGLDLITPHLHRIRVLSGILLVIMGMVVLAG